MKLIVATAAALAALLPVAQAQTAPAQAAPTATAKFNLDTPIEALVADAKAKAVLDTDLPGVTTHPSYEVFKAASLRELQPMSGGKLTDDLLKKVETDLATVK